MNEYRDLSRLPDDPQYWDELEARILAHAGTPPVVPAAAATSWFAAYAWPLSMVAAAATIAVLLLTPPRSPTSARSLLPLPVAEPMFNTFFETATPPSVGALIVGTSRDGNQ